MTLPADHTVFTCGMHKYLSPRPDENLVEGISFARQYISGMQSIYGPPPYMNPTTSRTYDDLCHWINEANGLLNLANAQGAHHGWVMPSGLAAWVPAPVPGDMSGKATMFGIERVPGHRGPCPPQTCKRCQETNDYADWSMLDGAGKYTCYSCRRHHGR